MLAMLALVLLFRTLIPAGYMIAPRHGGLALTLCEGRAAPATTGHEGHEAPSAPKQPCAYAALAAPALPPAPPQIGTPLPPPASASELRTAPAAIRPGPLSLPPPSTGPPHQV